MHVFHPALRPDAIQINKFITRLDRYAICLLVFLFHPFIGMALQLFRYILDASASVRLFGASEIIPLLLNDVKRFSNKFIKVLPSIYSVSFPRSI